MDTRFIEKVAKVFIEYHDFETTSVTQTKVWGEFTSMRNLKV